MIIKDAFHRSNDVDHDLGLVNERNVKSNADAISSHQYLPISTG